MYCSANLCERRFNDALSVKHVAGTPFKAGKITLCKLAWRELTSDPWILNCVNGMYIRFLTKPIQLNVPRPFRLTQEEEGFVDKEVETLMDKGVLCLVKPTHGQWISNIFLRPKSNGKFRMILDLTLLNKHIAYEHFKMFSLKTALELLTEGAWMASADLTDAYYSVPICKTQRKFLRFVWRKNLLEYQALPNGLSPGPRVFTKLLKPLYANMGQKGHLCFPYIDDSFVMGDTKEQCDHAITDLTRGFKRLGFTINVEKSSVKA